MSTTEDILIKLRQAYIAGIPTHLEEMENMIINIENNHEFQENFDALYRKTHSLKGSGATYDYRIITVVCHQLEDFLTDELQFKKQINPHKINTAFKYIDILKGVYGILLENSNNFIVAENQLDTLKRQNKKLRAMLIEPPESMYQQICRQTLSNANIHYSLTSSGASAIQRLLHESFDLLITSRETPELSGIALIAALKLNKRCNVDIKSIMITSNPVLDIPKKLKPDFTILKGVGFSEKLELAINHIVTGI